MTAMFRDSDEALKFAYRVEQTTQFALNGYAEVRGGGPLSPHELRAQAVFIRKIVAELPEHLRGYGWAAYTWCELSDLGQRECIAFVSTKVACETPKMVELLVRRYLELGEETRPTQRRIAEDLKVHKNTVQHWEGKVNEAMTELERAFFDRVDRHFIRISLIERPAARDA